MTLKAQEAITKGISKAAHAGLNSLIPAVLAPTELLTKAALGFIPPAIKPTGRPLPHAHRCAVLLISISTRTRATSNAGLYKLFELR
jgi:hypothetical protein